MAICTFFGHRDCPDSIKPKLREVLVNLIENCGVDTFYVGRQGTFDAIVWSVLRELSASYPHICYAVVLAALPDKHDPCDLPDTMLPEGIEHIHPRFAVSWRNDWMLRQSDYVVTYITRTWGGAAGFAEKAAKQKKAVINLAFFGTP